MRPSRTIAVTLISLVLTAGVPAAADPPPFVVLEIATHNGLRSATVRVSPGPKGIITVVPGATFGARTITRIDEDGVLLSDGSKIGIDRDLSYPYVHRYDALLGSQAASPPSGNS